MKYVILVPDGMSDYPIEELGGKTPLEIAKKPNMDYIASRGVVGKVKTIPDGFSPGSDVANLALFGYDPKNYYPGRAPLEAANLGIKLKDDEIAFRCNLVTVFDEKMADYSSGHITTQEADKLIKILNEKLGSKEIKFYTGTSYRHIAVIKKDNFDFSDTVCIPPHDIIGQEIKKFLPKGKSALKLIELMRESQKVLEQSEINLVRLDLKENPANMIWLWGQGQKINFEPFKDKFGLTGGVISAVDLIKGIGKCIGLKVIDVEGATGYYDTNYAGKADAAINYLKRNDFLYLHLEATDEAGHNAHLQEKILAIERFDQLIVGKILEYLQSKKEDFRILITPDHATPIKLRTHTNDPVPFAMMGKGIVHCGINEFNEAKAATCNVFYNSAKELIEFFLKPAN